MAGWEGRVVVYGPPRPQGSKRIVPRRGSTGKVLLIDASPAARPWRNELVEAMKAVRPPEPNQILRVRVTVYVARPQTHYGTGRNSGCLKLSAPTLPTMAPDLDKVLRAVGDAAECAGWVRNDSHIVEWFATRCWADSDHPPGTYVHGEAGLAIQQDAEP